MLVAFAANDSASNCLKYPLHVYREFLDQGFNKAAILLGSDQFKMCSEEEEVDLANKELDDYMKRHRFQSYEKVNGKWQKKK